LFLDADGIPVSYRLFDGNVPDTSTLPTVLAEFKTAFGCERIVVVADNPIQPGGLVRPRASATRRDAPGLELGQAHIPGPRKNRVHRQPHPGVPGVSRIGVLLVV